MIIRVLWMSPCGNVSKLCYVGRPSGRGWRQVKWYFHSAGSCRENVASAKNRNEELSPRIGTSRVPAASTTRVETKRQKTVLGIFWVGEARHCNLDTFRFLCEDSLSANECKVLPTRHRHPTALSVRRWITNDISGVAEAPVVVLDALRGTERRLDVGGSLPLRKFDLVSPFRNKLKQM